MGAPAASGVNRADVLLIDGTVAAIRPLLPGDKDALLALHERASDESLHMRFFSSGRRAAYDYVEHLQQETDTLALVAVTHEGLVALATAEPVGPDAAEVAFLVDEEHHGLGLGSLLLEHLAAAGRDRGYSRFEAEVLPENHAMIGVFREAGFTVARHTEFGSTHLDMDTVASARAVEAADARECHAEARSLQPLLYPHAVAVCGARRNGSGVGAAVLRSIRAGDFQGALYAVHPRAGHGATVEDVPAYPTMADLPGPVDLVVVAVPATRVVATLRDAADAGVRAAVVISSGFEELGDEGRRLQREMLELARERSIRVVGPNCLGLMSNHPDIRLNATFSGAVPPVGGLAVASQSGGVGIVLSDVAHGLGLGIGSFVSLGNKADVSSNDLLAAWLDDPRVTGAALYLESFGNAAKFARFARRFAERKPLLAVVGGRSAGGRRAGASHTAAVASPAVGVAALFAQAGVTGCDGAEDMAETALLLAEQPGPVGPRVAVFSNAGGMGVLAADAADEWGLSVPELSPELRSRLARHVTGTTGTANPVDAGAGASPADFGAITATLLGSDEVDAVVVVLVATGVTDATECVRAIGRARARHRGKPLVLVPAGGLEMPDDVPGVTVLPTARSAVRALSRAVRRSQWLAVPHEPPQPADRERSSRARARARELLARRAEPTSWLEPEASRELLRDYGLCCLGEIVDDPLAATRTATEIGFPVAVKVADRRVVHKTDRGLVRVGLTSPAEVVSAMRAFEAELGFEHVPVLVQPIVSGVELALGLVRDAGFGPLVMVAAGGIATEVLDDRVFLMPPVTRADAERAVRSLRLWPLLSGYRGLPPVDLDALLGLVVSVGALAEEVPEVAELDLNPVMAAPDGVHLVDVKVRLAPGIVVDAGVPRRLRQAP
jgi:acyl-CoA synthetase (NDP forming)/GNAT superfamily N-acetyltransferase